MKKNKMNKYLIWGILINSIVVITKMFLEISDGFVCFGTGLGMSLFLLGIYAMNNDMTKARNFKRSLMRRFMGAK